jgi:hypothetical protein
MIIMGYKEDGVCRVIRNLGSGSTISSIYSKVGISGTYSRCLLSAEGPVIFFAVGWVVTAQALICDPDLANPGIVVDHAYLHNVLCPHCLEVLKKRKILGDNDDLDPAVALVVLSKGVFYSCEIKTGDVDESDSYLAPAPFDDSAFFGTLGDSEKKGWDLLQQAVDIDLKQSPMETYPLVRIDDQRFVFEFKMTPNSPWEECAK